MALRLQRRSPSEDEPRAQKTAAVLRAQENPRITLTRAAPCLRGKKRRASSATSMAMNFQRARPMGTRVRAARRSVRDFESNETGSFGLGSGCRIRTYVSE